MGDKINNTLYNMTKYFVGKTFVYRLRHRMGRQGEALVIGGYKKLGRRKINLVTL